MIQLFFIATTHTTTKWRKRWNWSPASWKIWYIDIKNVKSEFLNHRKFYAHVNMHLPFLGLCLAFPEVFPSSSAPIFCLPLILLDNYEGVVSCTIKQPIYVKVFINDRCRFLLQEESWKTNIFSLNCLIIIFMRKHTHNNCYRDVSSSW